MEIQGSRVQLELHNLARGVRPIVSTDEIHEFLATYLGDLRSLCRPPQ